MKIKLSRKIFEKYSNIKFHEEPSTGSRVVPSTPPDGRTDGQTGRQTDMTKLTLAFRSFTESPKNYSAIPYSVSENFIN
jgi:hypothetical protein